MWKNKLLGWFKDLDRILRGKVTQPDALKDADLDVSVQGLAAVVGLLAMGYGLCMGTYAVFRGTEYAGQLAQFVATTLKLPLLFFLTMAITLPSLYVFNVIFGSRLTLPAVVRLLLASLGVNMAVLASLGPIVAFFSVSTENYRFMVLLNVLMMTVSGVFGLMFLLQTLNRLTRIHALQHTSAPPPPQAVDPTEEELKESVQAEIIEPSALDTVEQHALGAHVQRVFRLWFVVFGVVGAQMGLGVAPIHWKPQRAVPTVPTARLELLRIRLAEFHQSVHLAGRVAMNQTLWQRFSRLLLEADDILRRKAGLATAAPSPRVLLRLATYVGLFGLAYGATMGTYRGFLADTQPTVILGQMLFSAVKVPLLLIATFLLSLPFFFVINTILGLRSDFAQAVRAVTAAQAGLTITLASLAPLTFFWYFSIADRDAYQAAILINGFMFAVASLAAQWLVRGYYAPLVARNPRHRAMLWMWVLIYTLVGIQMGWILRPFIGAPDSPLQFFRPEVFQENAYVVVFKLIRGLLAG